MKQVTRLTTAVAVCSWFLTFLNAAVTRTAAGQTADERLQHEIPRLMAAAEIPGLSVAVIRDGRVSWTGAFGNLGDSAKTSGNDQSIFAAASLGKPVFSYVVLRLVERGLFDLDKPLAEYLVYPRLEHDDRYTQITGRMVLSHGTGLPNWGGERLELKFPPGQGFGYSGEGFVYLQKAIEHLTGATLEELARREIFERLEMHRTSYIWRDAFEGNAVTGHDAFDEPQELPHHTEGNAAHSLLTTAEDYARFVSALLQHAGLSAQTVANAFTAQRDVARPNRPTRADGKVSWGLGWGLQRGAQGKAFWHWGDSGAFRCYVVAYPESGDAVVYFTNSYNGLSIVEDLVSLVVQDDHWAIDWLHYERYDDPGRLARKSLEQAFLTGVAAGRQRFRTLREASPDVFRLALMGNVGRYLTSKGRTEEAIAAVRLNVELYPDSTTVHEQLAEVFLSAHDYQGAIDSYQRSLALTPIAKRIDWVRERMRVAQQPVTVAVETLQGYAGDYGPRHVTLRGTTLFYRRNGNPEYRLIPLAEDTFALDGLETFRVRFVTEGGRRAIKIVGLDLDGSSDETRRTGT